MIAPLLIIGSLVAVVVTFTWPRAHRYRLVAFTAGGVACGFMLTDMALLGGLYLPVDRTGRQISVFGLTPEQGVREATFRLAWEKLGTLDTCHDGADGPPRLCAPPAFETVFTKAAAAQNLDEALAALQLARELPARDRSAKTDPHSR